MSKAYDTNLHTLQDILIKFNQTGAKREFMPYNKSILTRVLAPLLCKENILTIVHHSRQALLSHLRNNVNLFGYFDKLWGDKRLKKRKVNSQEALKQLELKFGKEVKNIYEVLRNFRQGMQSFETYTMQQAQSLPTSSS